MRRANRIPNLGGARAIVLHQPHANAAALVRQLGAIGLQAIEAWPELPAGAAEADFLFFDADTAFDAQFGWAPGEAPLPTVALLGSEAPGRIEWTLSHRADAHLVKPIGGAGVYSALLIARQAFEERRCCAAEIAGLKAQVLERRTLVSAIILMMDGGLREDEAFAELQRLAMTGRVPLETAAAQVLAASRRRRTA